MPSVTFNDAGASANWVVREGCTWSRTFTATSGGSAVNLTGYTITAEVTSGPTSDTAVKSFAVTVTNAAAGEFRISVAASSADLAPGTYWWSLQWDTGSTQQALCSGNFIVKDWTL